MVTHIIAVSRSAGRPSMAVPAAFQDPNFVGFDSTQGVSYWLQKSMHVSFVRARGLIGRWLIRGITNKHTQKKTKRSKWQQHWLVVSSMFFSISYMGCHSSHFDFHISFIFFKMVIAPPTSHRQSQLLPVVLQKAVAEVSKIGNL